MLNTPYFQHRMSILVEKSLESWLKTEVSIGQIDIGLLNRVIIDKMTLKDQAGKTLIDIPRFSASFDILPLFKGEISIRTVQLYGLKLHLYKNSASEKLNAAFLLEKFQSKEKKTEPSSINLRINSILMRRGVLSYDEWDVPLPATENTFSPSHLNFKNLSATVSLKHLTEDSLHLIVKRMGFSEQSGFVLSRLKFDLKANKHAAQIDELLLRLPKSTLAFSPILVTYQNDKAPNSKSLAEDKFHYTFSLLPSSHISFKDLAAFLPVFRDSRLTPHLTFSIAGSDRKIDLEHLRIWTSGSNGKSLGFDMEGEALLQKTGTSNEFYSKGSLSKLQATREGLEQLVTELTAYGIEMESVDLASLEEIDATTRWEKNQNSAQLQLSAQTNAGKLDLKAKLRDKNRTILDANSSNLEITAELKGEEIDLTRLLPEKQLGKTNFSVEATAGLKQGKLDKLQSKGAIESFEYKGYTYKKGFLEASYSKGKGASAQIRMDDLNASFNANAQITTESGKKPNYQARIEVAHLNPYHLNWAGDKQRDMEISLVAKADCAGSDLNDLTGYVHVDSVMIRKQGKIYPIPYLHLEAQQGKTRRMVLFSSPFLEADMQGSLEYSAIPTSILRMMRPYIPSLFRWEDSGSQKPENNFNFFVHVRDTKTLTELLNLPLEIYENSYLSGFIEDSTGTLQLKGNFPSLRYQNNKFRNMTLHCNGTPDGLDCDFNSDMFMKNGTLINFALAAKAKDDQLSGNITWENHDEVEYQGKIELSAILKKRQHSNRLYADVLLHPTEVVFRDSAWKINEAAIRIDSLIQIERFSLQHGRQSIRVAGTISKSANDSLLLNLQNVQLGYIFDIANFHSVDFDGQATGKAKLTNLFSKPRIDADMQVANFLFNDSPMGHLKIKGGFHAATDSIPIDALIERNDGKVTSILGAVRPKRKNLDLHIDAEGCNIGFIQPYVEGIFSGFQGNASGNFHFFGGFKSLQLEGKGLANAGFRIDVLGTEFHVADSIYITPRRFSLTQASVTDGEGHRGRVTARLNHTFFKNFNYNLQLDSDGMQLVNKAESFDLPFFGKAYARGTVYLSGNAERLSVDGALATTGNTEFCYKLTGNTVAEDNAFIQFTPIKFGNNPSPNTVSDGSTSFYSNAEKKENTLPASGKGAEQYVFSGMPEDVPIDVRLNLLLDINPEAQMRVIVDPKAGDYISCTGNGNIRIDYFNKGDFNMFGTYTINKGMYKFSLQEVIRKDFTIREGSSLTFSGNPYRALCNLRAIYTVNSVSLRDLGTDVVNVLQTNQTSVRVNCVMDVTGMLSSPEIHLGIELPNENEEVQSVVRNFISTEDQMNMQILYLLGIGKFYTPDYANKTGNNSNAMSSVLSSTLSGQLNDMLSQVINSNKWNFGVNGSTGEEGWTDMEFQGMLSGQLLNNRLLINGNFGYRDNSMYTNQQSNFIGDFDIEYLLTKSGDIRLRAYNKSNDRYSTKTTLNTQGIGVVVRKDFDYWWQLINRRKKKEKQKNED